MPFALCPLPSPKGLGYPIPGGQLSDRKSIYLRIVVHSVLSVLPDCPTGQSIQQVEPVSKFIALSMNSEQCVTHQRPNVRTAEELQIQTNEAAPLASRQPM